MIIESPDYIISSNLKEEMLNIFSKIEFDKDKIYGSPCVLIGSIIESKPLKV